MENWNLIEKNESLPLAVRKAFALHAGLNKIGAVSAGAEFFAGGFDTEALADGSIAETTSDAVVEEIEVVVFKLDDFSAVDTDEVVVGRAVEEVGVVGRLAVAEFDFVNETCFVEQGQGAVNGGSGGRGASGAEAVEKLFGGEVFVGSEDDFNDFIALRGLPETFFADEFVEPLPNAFFHVEREHSDLD